MSVKNTKKRCNPENDYERAIFDSCRKMSKFVENVQFFETNLHKYIPRRVNLTYKVKSSKITIFYNDFKFINQKEKI